MALDRSRITVGCLFAAIGGFCRAFQECGATVVWANEKDHFARDTFVENFPGVRHIHCPIEELSVESHELEPVDVITAGFPCQPFSVAGEKLGLKDERGMLFLHIIRLIREFGKNKPKILLLENVKHFRNHDEGRTFRRVQSEIQRAGYWFSDKDAQVLNTATHTNIPQNRDRIFMAAFSCDHFASNTYEFPDPLPNGSLRNVKEFLDLGTKAATGFYFKPGSQYHPMFVEAMEKGGRDSVYQLRRSYVRENMSGMCFTLMANMGDGDHNIPVIKDRWGISITALIPLNAERPHAVIPPTDMEVYDRRSGCRPGAGFDGVPRRLSQMLSASAHLQSPGHLLPRPAQ
jgi:DNA (cytosine-5)-methyltransferase 1